MVYLKVKSFQYRTVNKGKQDLVLEKRKEQGNKGAREQRSKGTKEQGSKGAKEQEKHFERHRCAMSMEDHGTGEQGNKGTRNMEVRRNCLETDFTWDQ